MVFGFLFLFSKKGKMKHDVITCNLCGVMQPMESLKEIKMSCLNHWS